MADSTLPNLGALAATPADDDLLYIVDVSDTTDSADGTNKRIERSDLVGGLATSASVTDVADDLATHEANTSNPHTVTKAQVGLSNVDNTTDAGKPISTLTQTALDGKVSKSGDTVTGNLTLRDASSPTKQYRLKSDGSALDFDAGGTDLYMSVYTGADFTGTQRNKIRLESAADTSKLIRNWQFTDDPTGTVHHSIDGTTGGGVVFNEDGHATGDVRIEGDTDANLVFTDAGTDKVGIGNAAPDEKLHITGNFKVSGTGLFGGDVSVPDEAYDGTAWNGSLEVPTKNAIRDKIETMGGGGQTLVTKVVAASGGDYTTLKDAIDASSSGWTIWVKDATTETANCTSSTANLTIIGSNPHISIIGLNSRVFTLSGANVRFINCGYSSTTGRLVLSGVDSWFKDGYVACTSGSTAGNGLLEMTGARARCSGSQFYMTNSTTGHNTVYMALHGKVSDCRFYLDGHASNTTAVKLDDDYGGVVGCNFVSNTSNSLVYVQGKNYSVVTGNNFQGTTGGTQTAFASSGNSSWVFSANTIKSCSRAVTGGGNYYTMANNVIEVPNSGVGYFHSADSTYANITGNTFKGATLSGNTGIDRQSSSAMNYCNITGNTFTLLNVGINAGSTWTHNIVDNIYRGNTTDINNFPNMRLNAINASGLGMSAGTALQTTRVAVLKNTSGGTIAAGKTVVLKNSVSNSNEITTTTTAADPNVWGITQEDITNNSFGIVLLEGHTSGGADADGTTDIAVGDYLTTFTTAGALRKAGAGETAIAIARGAYTTDSVTAQVLTVQVIRPRIV